jgi:hypothetical protein
LIASIDAGLDINVTIIYLHLWTDLGILEILNFFTKFSLLEVIVVDKTRKTN